MGDRAIFTADPDSEGPARAELRRVLAPDISDGGAAEHPLAIDSPSENDPNDSHHEKRPAIAYRLTPVRLGPGIFLVALPVSFTVLAARLYEQPPLFIRHVQPVQQELSVDQSLADLDRLAAAAAALAPDLDSGQSFSVQTRLLHAPEAASTNPEHRPLSPFIYGRFDVNERLAKVLQDATGAPLDVRDPCQVISVLATPTTGFLGLSLATENLSSWAGGAIRFAREEAQISRSEFKLLEAMVVFDLSLPAHGRALDLGAAPGGWTRLLRRAGLEVTAVDPGDLDPRLRDDPGIHHVRSLAQAYRWRWGEIDVLVNDMRMDARDSARLMVEFAPCLAPGGLAVMTVKLPHERMDTVAHQAIGLLIRRYRVIGARQLFHNRSEITVALRRRDEDESTAASGRTGGERE